MCEIVQDAVKRGDSKKIEELITHGMRVELEDREGNTMISSAADGRKSLTHSVSG